MNPKLFAVIAISFFVASPALAQTGTTTASAQTPEQVISGTEQDVRTIVVADVNLGDLNYEETKDGVSGNFSLYGKLGKQNDIAYGIVVRNEKNEIKDFLSLGKGESVNEGEIKIIPFSYTFPTSLRGTLTVTVMAETSTGVPLGSQSVLKKNFGNIKKPTFICQGDVGFTEVSCVSPKGNHLSVSYYTGSLFLPPVVSTELDLVPGEEKKLVQPDKPGRYHVIIKNEGGEMVSQALRVPGPYGVIENIIVYKGEAGIIDGTFVVNASPLKGSALKVSLFKSDGSPCGETTLSITEPVSNFSLPASCGEGTLETVLSDSNGVVLDSQTTGFLVKGFTAFDSWNYLRVALGLWVLALIGLIFLLVRKFKSKNITQDIDTPKTLGGNGGQAIITSLIIMLGFFSFAQPASALTLNFQGWNPFWREIGVFGNAVVSTNKAAYLPGESMVVSSYYNLDVDVPGGLSRVTLSIGYPPGAVLDVPVPGGGAPAFNFVDIVVSSLPLTTVTDNTNFFIPITTTYGSHYLANRLLVSTKNSVGGVIDSKITQGNLTFKVSSACTVEEELGGTYYLWNDNTSEFADFWANFSDSNVEFTGAGFSGPDRFRACGVGGTGCGGPMGIWSAAPATRRPTIPAACSAYAPACANGLDDDGDGKVDANDPGCHTDGNAGNAGSYKPTLTTEAGVALYTYSFNGNGATTDASPPSVNQAAGTSIASPTNPSRTNYTFTGWSPAIPATMPVNGGSSAAQWTATQYTITASSGANGSISPSGAVAVSSGGSQSFTITPNVNYNISSVTVDGVNQGAISPYTFSNVTANHTISATFVSGASGNFTAPAPICSIPAGSSGCGTAPISWTSSGLSTVVLTDCGGGVYTSTGSGPQSSTVYIPYNAGCYQIHNGSAGGPLLDSTNGTSSCAAGSTWNGSICLANQYTITASSGANGSISPSGAVAVSSGGSQSFTITPNVNYNISSVTVDGVNQGAISSYPFTNVTANHTISATFAAAPTINYFYSNGTNGTTINAGQSATLTWSASNAGSCTGTGFSTGGATSNNVGVSTGPLSTTSTYQLTCGTAFAQVTVSVTQPQITSFTADPTRVKSGGSSTIKWSTTGGATGCAVTKNGSPWKSGSSGSYVENNITSQTTYILSCNSVASQSLTVNIVPVVKEF